MVGLATGRFQFMLGDEIGQSSLEYVSCHTIRQHLIDRTRQSNYDT
jgi:hypothetical protein